MLVSTTARVPFTDPAELFARAKAEERVFWEQPSERFSLVAIGAAARLTGHGDDRFSQVTAAWRGLMSRAVTDVVDPAPVAAPVCLGGFAFDPERLREPHWDGYPDALLTVPRFLFTSCGGSSWLTVSALVNPGCDTRTTADAAADDLCRLLEGGVAVAGGGEWPGSEVAPADEAEADRWKEAVAAVVRDVRRGTIEKLVLARRLRARVLGPLEPAAVIRRLRAEYGGCTVFAFARGESCFLGAAPERLVRLDAGIVRADCLAGSTARSANEDEDQALGEALFADQKERHEHALVVRALRDALGPLCHSLSVPATPNLLSMPNVQHLHTPVVGAVNGERHVLELVERLHPTPATGGLPTRAALPLIRSYEKFDRGWYAGPVGWVDGRGGGEFVVAIRSALLGGNQALLYAGCGIVAGSDPEREYEESCLKLRPMLWALNGNQT